MTQTIHYSEYLRNVSLVEHEISYNLLTPEINFDANGNIIPHVAPPITLNTLDIFRLIKTHAQSRFMEQFRVVIPLAIYLLLFLVFILNQVVGDPWSMAFGLLGVIIGLMLFMEGLKLGLMPLGEIIGHTLPRKSALPAVLIIAFILGVGVTFAEPAIGALQTAGQLVSVETAPYLYTILSDWPGALVMVVGCGVGMAALLGTLRLIYGWSLKPMIYITLVPALGLSLYASVHPELQKILGLAWDCGAVTTGPVTVPLVLALGIGIATSTGKGNASLSGFGIVTLASLFPIIGVLGLAIYVVSSVPVENIILAASHSNLAATTPGWDETTPGREIVLGLRAILPLVLFLYLVMKLMLGEKIRHSGIIGYGIVLTVAGMCIFNLGLTYGLSRLGSESGSLLPAAFTHITAVETSPLYIYVIGLILVLTFAWLLGFGATLAEPALNALGLTVQNLTQGVFKKSTLMYAVSGGVAFGITLGLAKIIFDLPLAWLLLPTYLLAVVLTFLSSEEFVNIAWDSAGVTTGPITVPLVLAMGLGIGDAVQAVEGFGMLSLASIGPILSVLSTGLWFRLKTHLETETAQQL
ncbi:MAG: DUF1538 domain-containing protein [Gammaproteobacteria bacterium]|nr:MAG: DUF1538 domain-containing protein [Gammaproteobacteria bacterium]